MVIGPHPHMAHAQDGQGSFAAQRQVTLHTRAQPDAAILNKGSSPCFEGAGKQHTLSLPCR